MHLEKFVHTTTGKIIMSILLGFGLASLFRTVCKNGKCVTFRAPPLEDFVDNIYKTPGDKCVQYTPVATTCSKSNHTKILDFDDDILN